MQVANTRCDQCLFSANRIVSEERMREVLTLCQKKKRWFICHKTKNSCCRGFYDSPYMDSLLQPIAQQLRTDIQATRQIGERLGAILFI